MPEFEPPAPDALKAALEEALHENRDWLKELVQEALLEMAHAEARREADLRTTRAARGGAYGLPPGRA